MANDAFNSFILRLRGMVVLARGLRHDTPPVVLDAVDSSEMPSDHPAPIKPKPIEVSTEDVQLWMGRRAARDEAEKQRHTGGRKAQIPQGRKKV